MDLNKSYFTSFLTGNGTKTVLFEPFISRYHTETLIWRRGNELWDTPEHYIDTLIALSERTLSDVIFADIRAYRKEDKLSLFHAICDRVEKISPRGFGIITDCKEDVALAEKCGAVDVLMLYGDVVSDVIPSIRAACRMDEDINSAISCGYCGCFVSSGIDELLPKYGKSIRLLGGLAELVGLVGNSDEPSSPVKIYSTVASLSEKYRKEWACGSGGMIHDNDYLTLISLLGAFGRTR